MRVEMTVVGSDDNVIFAVDTALTADTTKEEWQKFRNAVSMMRAEVEDLLDIEMVGSNISGNKILVEMTVLNDDGSVVFSANVVLTPVATNEEWYRLRSKLLLLSSEIDDLLSIGVNEEPHPEDMLVIIQTDEPGMPSKITEQLKSGCESWFSMMKHFRPNSTSKIIGEKYIGMKELNKPYRGMTHLNKLFE